MKLFRPIILAAAFGVVALTPSAVVAKPPAGVPGAANNSHSSQVPTLEQARASARKQCLEFSANFAANPQQLDRCVTAGVRVRRSRVTPHEACSGLGLSRKREAGERRSDFNACVVAAARGAREGEEGDAA